ncbi:hypothetical protein SAMN05892877_116103 [Rhizobium subbaraonis]|uniref:Uncharacterized protein n=1 Tax=Rhizobium subbaraonis TaxID=908946 RepID=A0A285UUT2_9HYPH|nr:hypothetical protein SAMN05892877_116103 [Rhizobium subbaraonis]
MPTPTKSVQMSGKLGGNLCGVSFRKALARRGARNANSLEEEIKVFSTYLVQGRGITNSVSEFICECIVEARRENVVTG